MKLRIGFLLIVVATAATIGVINLIVTKIAATPMQPATARFTEKLPSRPANVIKPTQKPIKPQVIEAEIDDDDDDDDEVSDNRSNNRHVLEPEPALSSEDKEKIQHVAALSDSELLREFETIRSRVEEEDLFGQLESGDLSADQEEETKEVLEQFALLDLEETRRKYMAMDPELRDPLRAHRDSLSDIRALLDEE